MRSLRLKLDEKGQIALTEAAAAQFVSAVQQDPLNPVTLRNCAQMAMFLDGREAGHKRGHVGEFPTSPLHRRGEICDDFYVQALRCNPLDSETHFQIGLMLMTRYWADAAALWHLLRALELFPERVDLRRVFIRQLCQDVKPYEGVFPITKSAVDSFLTHATS
jgi:hypothetical protein